MPRSTVAERWRAMRRRTRLNRERNRFDSVLDPVECTCGKYHCQCDLENRAKLTKDEIKRRALIVKDELFGHLRTDPRDDDRRRFGVIGGVGFYHAEPIPDNGRPIRHIGRAQYCRKLIREWKRRRPVMVQAKT